jgi:hypothetical protein
LSVAIPILAQLPTGWFPAGTLLQPADAKDLAITVVGLLVTFITGLASFFGWEKTWQSRTLAIEDLELARAIWEIEMSAAERITAAEAKDQAMVTATKNLVVTTYGKTRIEAEAFFGSLRAPESKKP